MKEKLDRLYQRFQLLEKEMSDPSVISNQTRFKELSREHAQLMPVVQNYEKYQSLLKEQSDSEELLSAETDDDMKRMLFDEIENLKEKVEKLKQELVIQLLPKDPNDGKDIIMEIRAGTGGEEAALFAGDLFRMYTRFIDKKGWKMEYIDGSETEIGGFKEVVFSVRSSVAYENLKLESGGHRVQRVPTTESGGRIHTSAVTVAVMPEAEETDIAIDPNDIRVDVYRSTGHGGQSVNTTDSAVRITHIPTGMVVTCQDEKSQLKNKSKAMRVLRARLYEKEQDERRKEESELRKSQIGSGDRSDRIRTYNYPQSRVTDHRIGLTLYSLESFLEGEMDEIIDALRKSEVEEMLKRLYR
ncbi:MAG: peptide chain release factor 1 [Spirochaetia bacterium]|jgi:peptide chain release factor 1|nr:peptide chain release factor 1 [Spirochaetia bacterium]